MTARGLPDININSTVLFVTQEAWEGATMSLTLAMNTRGKRYGSTSRTPL